MGQNQGIENIPQSFKIDCGRMAVFLNGNGCFDYSVILAKAMVAFCSSEYSCDCHCVIVATSMRRLKALNVPFLR